MDEQTAAAAERAGLKDQIEQLEHDAAEEHERAEAAENATYNLRKELADIRPCTEACTDRIEELETNSDQDIRIIHELKDKRDELEAKLEELALCSTDAQGEVRAALAQVDVLQNADTEKEAYIQELRAQNATLEAQLTEARQAAALAQVDIVAAMHEHTDNL